MALAHAIYTDVSKEESFDGVPGFNFQAISAEIDGTDQQIIVQNMLHSVQSRWDLSHDAEDHPPSASLLHTNGRTYLSRGKSTGLTNSGRRGNQLTQILVAHTATDLDCWSPPQVLLSSSLWTLEKSSRKDLPEIEFPAEIPTEVGVESLMEWATAEEQRRLLLPHVLTAIDDALGAEPRRAVFKHDDLEEFLRWMTLGTLLLTPEKAMEFSFRGLVHDPWSGPWHAVGVGSAFAVDTADGDALDLQALPPAGRDVSPVARAIGEWLTRHEWWEVLELIELARRWEPALGAQHATAGAELVTGVATDSGQQAWAAGVDIIDGLGRSGLTEDLDAYFDELAEPITTYQLTSEDDFVRAGNATRAALNSGSSRLADALLRPSIEFLSAAPEMALVWTEALEVGPRWAWPIEDEEWLPQCAQALTEVMGQAPERALPALLTMAKPLTPWMDPLASRRIVERLVENSVTNPNLVIGCENWYGGERLAGNVAERVAEYARQGRSEVWNALADGRWDDFIQQNPQVSQPLRVWAAAGALSKFEPTQRHRAIEEKSSVGEAWPLALHGTDPETHPKLWARCLSRQRCVTSLDAFLLNRVEMLLKSDPHKSMKAWLPIVEVLDRPGYVDSPATPGLLSRFERHVDSADTLFKAMKRSLRGGRRGDEAPESGRGERPSRRRMTFGEDAEDPDDQWNRG